jgi:hypothetical protein
MLRWQVACLLQVYLHMEGTLSPNCVCEMTFLICHTAAKLTHIRFYAPFVSVASGPGGVGVVAGCVWCLITCMTAGASKEEMSEGHDLEVLLHSRVDVWFSFTTPRSFIRSIRLVTPVPFTPPTTNDNTHIQVRQQRSTFYEWHGPKAVEDRALRLDPRDFWSRLVAKFVRT